MEPAVAIARPSRPFAFWPAAGLFVAAVAAALAAAVAIGILDGTLEGLRVVPAHALLGALRRPTSVGTQVLEGAMYLAMTGVLLLGLPAVAKRTRGELGLSPRGLLAWRQILGAVGIGLVFCIAEPLYLFATHQARHTQHGFENFAPSGAAEVVAVGIVLVVVGPIGEELLFRALLFGALAQRLPVVWSAAISGILFGAVHADLVLFPVLAMLGFLTATIYARTGNLWAAVALHATNNGVAFLALSYESLAKHA